MDFLKDPQCDPDKSSNAGMKEKKIETPLPNLL